MCRVKIMSKFSELPGKERPQEYLTRQDLFEFQEAISHPRTYKSFIKERLWYFEDFFSTLELQI